MASKTASDIKSTLEAGSYPYPVRFYTTKQRFPIYPYCEIIKAPQSTNEGVTDTSKDDGFSITLYVKYMRGLEVEEEDQTTIENTILSLLEAQDFGTSKLYSETKSWSRLPMQKPFGSQSTITIKVVDRVSTSGSGVLGSEMTMVIGYGSTDTSVTILSLKEDIGPTISSHYNDERKRYIDPDNFNEGEFTLEYENTSVIESEIDGYRDTGNSISCRLTRKTTNKDFNAVFGATVKTGQYDKIERAVTKMYLVPA